MATSLDQEPATMTLTAPTSTAPDGSAVLVVPSASRATWHPALLAVPLSLGLAVAALAVASGADALDADLVVGAIVIAGWTFGGAAVAARRPLCRLGAVLLSGPLVAAAGLLASAGDAAGWTGAAGSVADALPAIAVFVLPAIALHLLVGLPTGGLTPGWRRVGVGIGYAIGLALGALAAGHGVNDLVLLAAWASAGVAGLPAAHAAYLRSAGIERQRLQWVGCGATLAAEVVLIVVALDMLVDWPERPGLVALLASLFVPLAFAASASPRLVTRVDRFLVHTVSLTGLTAVTVGVYVVVVIGLGQVPSDADRRLLGLSMAAAALSAALYVPARERLEDVANRIVYGERHAPDEVLRTFGSRLTRAIPMDELLLQLAESLKKTLNLTRAEVWTGTSELLERTVSVPFADPANLVIGERERSVVSRAGVSGAAWVSVWLPALLEGRADAQVRVAPATHAGELLGLIVVERPADGDAFGENDDTMLTELARQAGLALHNVQLDSALQATLDEVRRANEDLKASRARIVATGDAERRKIERNLHDGAQQHLVALAVNLRLVQDLLTEDPETATEMLDQLAADVKETIAELRALAHGIFPPLLVDAGLGEALRAAGGRSPLDVDVAVDATGRYGSEVEAAVYFCCLEALQNAAKHAPGSSVTVHVWEDEGGLLFEVADDGPGFDVDAAVKGHGYTNMADRLGAIGGTVRWASAPGSGSRVSGSVPISSTTSAAT